MHKKTRVLGFCSAQVPWGVISTGRPRQGLASAVIAGPQAVLEAGFFLHHSCSLLSLSLCETFYSEIIEHSKEICPSGTVCSRLFFIPSSPASSSYISTGHAQKQAAAAHSHPKPSTQQQVHLELILPQALALRACVWYPELLPPVQPPRFWPDQDARLFRLQPTCACCAVHLLRTSYHSPRSTGYIEHCFCHLESITAGEHKSQSTSSHPIGS